MKSFVLTLARYVRAVGLLCAFLCLGQFANRYGVPLPAPIIGLLLLFLSLLFKVIPEYWVAPACTLLGRYMAVLFLPVGVGLMVNYAAVKQALLPLIVACVVSSAIVLLLVGFLIERQEKNTQMRSLKKHNAFKKEQKNV